jgi:hypothetical protein
MCTCNAQPVSVHAPLLQVRCRLEIELLQERCSAAENGASTAAHDADALRAERRSLQVGQGGGRQVSKLEEPTRPWARCSLWLGNLDPCLCAWPVQPPTARLRPRLMPSMHAVLACGIGGWRTGDGAGA